MTKSAFFNHKTIIKYIFAFWLFMCYHNLMKKKIKIAVDVDDCICNTLEMDYACAYHMMKNNLPNSIDKTYYDVTKSFNMDDGDLFYVKEKEYIIKHTSMYPKVFVKEVFDSLRKKGFEIIIITSRFNKYWKGKAELYLKKWLKKHNIKYDKIFADVYNKCEVCLKNGIDCLIEDNCENVRAVNSCGIKSILIKTSYNENYSNPLNVFAENWLDAYTILAKQYGFDGDDIISL